MRIHIARYSYLLMIALSFLCNISYPQIDSSADSFFPSQVGNVWRYRYAPNIEGQSMITKDSLTNKERYIFIDNSKIPAFKIDYLLNVTTNPMQSGYTALQYKLNSQKNETWIVWDTTSERVQRLVARVEDIFWGYAFGLATQFKKIGYYKQSVADTTNFEFWRYDCYLAAGFGLYLTIYDANQTADELIGCIINGNKYGTVLAVPNEQRYSFLSSYKLNPAFPNPFNPSTVISYQLAENNVVIIQLFDMIGKELAILVNEEQQKGYHQIRFTPQNLSSGIYLVRMTAGIYSQTTKIIYSK